MAESKLTTGEKDFCKQRRQQLDEWQSQHPHARPSAAQHLGKPAAKKKSKSSRA